MKTADASRECYQRLDMNSINFTSNVDNSKKEKLSPIEWTEDVLDGQRSIVIKK